MGEDASAVWDRQLRGIGTGDPFERGDEIKQWLAWYGRPEKIAIVDDSDDMADLHDFFVKTNWLVGLVPADVTRLIDLLK